MNILHYSLGFPPYRTGGLTKYCFDLMIGQKELGHNVMMLWPGKLKLIDKKIYIKKHRDVEGIQNFELINPIPVGLDEGIRDIKMYTKKGDKAVFISFLKSLKIEVIHIHTFMGIYTELLDAANELKIKTIFTTHDYFGICPKVTLFYGGSTCDDDDNCRRCVQCNMSALSLKKIIIMQSPVYRLLKNSIVIKALRKKHRSNFSNGVKIKKIIDESELEIRANEYKQLRKYYFNIFSKINVMHFNSNISKDIYSRYIKYNKSYVINISHREISDKRKKKEFSGNLKITYLSPARSFKGFNVLKDALDDIYQQGFKKFELNIFNSTNDLSPYMNIRNGYRYEELDEIFRNTDILIVPSVWYETFGFTVIEAVSHGVPIIVSENVGAKDILTNNDCGIIVNNDNLKNKILEIYKNRDILRKMNCAKVNSDLYNYYEHVNKVIECLYKESNEY